MSDFARKNIVLCDHRTRYYVIKGSNSFLPPIVFVHDWGKDGTMWFPALESLYKAGYTTYCLDLPGFGASEDLHEPWDLRMYAQALDEFIHGAGLPHALLVGHGFGGRVVIKLLASNPDFFKKAVLVDTSIRALKKPSGAALWFADKLAELSLPRWLESVRRGLYDDLGTEAYKYGANLRETFMKTSEEDLSRAIKKVRASVLLVATEKAGSTKDTETVQKSLKNGIIEVFSESRRPPFLSDTPRFERTVLSFIHEPAPHS